jgi:hypothetical protein
MLFTIGFFLGLSIGVVAVWYLLYDSGSRF